MRIGSDYLYFEAETFCVASGGFVWGFASFVVYLGLIFEAIWVFLVYAAWLNANARSRLLRRGLNLGCVLRNAKLMDCVLVEVLGIEEYERLPVGEIEAALAKAGTLKWAERREFRKEDGQGESVHASGASIVMTAERREVQEKNKEDNYTSLSRRPWRWRFK